MRDRHGFWLGAAVSSLLFGLVHFVPAPWPDTVLLQTTMVFTGLALAAIYEWRGTLVSCIVAHMSFNVIGVVFILWPLLERLIVRMLTPRPAGGVVCMSSPPSPGSRR